VRPQIVLSWSFCLAAATVIAGCTSALQPSPASSSGLRDSPSPAAVSTSPASSVVGPAVEASPTARPLPNDLATPPGTYVFSGDSSYGIAGLDITFAVADEGWVSWGAGVVTTEPDIRDQVGIGFANVVNLYEDPCRWVGTALDPAVGPSVEDLVEAFASQQRFRATSPKPVALAGYAGSYIELTIDPNLDFSRCDQGTVHSWIDVKGNSRYYQGPGQVEQLWVVDVAGTRVVIEGSSFPQASEADRHALAQIIESIRITPRA
jgi:hypothetical protein